MNDNNTPEPVSDGVEIFEMTETATGKITRLVDLDNHKQAMDKAEKEIDALRAEVAKLKENADAFQVRLRAAQKCLQELSVLGGGNSHGNCIAIAGLKSSGNIDYGADIMEELAKSQKLIASLRQELTESQRMLEMRTQDRNSLHGELMREKAESSKWKEKAEQAEVEMQRFRAEYVSLREALANNLDRDKDPRDTLQILVAVAINGLKFRDDELRVVKEERDGMRKALKMALWELDAADLCKVSDKLSWANSISKTRVLIDAALAATPAKEEI